MNNYKEWNEFLRNLFSEKYKTLKYYEHRHLRKEQIYEFLSTNLTIDKEHFITQMFFERSVTGEQRIEVVYYLGLKDCGWHLKNLRVLT